MPLDDRHIETRPHRHGPVATYQVFVEDFDRIQEEAESVGSDLTFATFWLSEAATSTFALPTIPNDWLHVFSAFEMAMLAGYGFGFYFLWRWWKHKGSLKRFMDRIGYVPTRFPSSGKPARNYAFRILQTSRHRQLHLWKLSHHLPWPPQQCQRQGF
jgi:hypothetical protein